MILNALFALSLASSPVSNNTPAAVNLSAIHSIYCTSGQQLWQGTGFLVAKNTLVTANHVQGANCIDATAGVKLKTYKTDKRHDLALMTGNIPLIGPYIKYSCNRPIAGNYYISYGQSSAGMPSFFIPILRNNVLRATNNMDKHTDDVKGFADSSGMRYYTGPIASGMSGGPVADIFGNVVAINNAGDNKVTVLFDLADTGLCTDKWDV